MLRWPTRSLTNTHPCHQSTHCRWRQQLRCDTGTWRGLFSNSILHCLPSSLLWGSAFKNSFGFAWFEIGSHCIALAGLQLRDLPASVSEHSRFDNCLMEGLRNGDMLDTLTASVLRLLTIMNFCWGPCWLRTKQKHELNPTEGPYAVRLRERSQHTCLAVCSCELIKTLDSVAVF